MGNENNIDNSQEFAVRIGDRIGPYTIERKLGSGGMAEVYFAIHGTLRRPAAIKVLKPALASDEVHLQRFLQEARAAASLVHPNIVQVYDVGQDGPIRYIAQEYVPGISLRQYLQEHGRLDVRHALSVLLQVLAALKKSSSSGIVHRDIKPDNMLLTSDGEVKVADFGLARLMLQDDPQLTRAGTTLGTPMYMSPEQLQEGNVDGRSDLYSLGVTLFHVLAGEPPFRGETPLALAMQHVQNAPPQLKSLRQDIPDSLCVIVHKLLSKQPSDRYGNPDDVLQALRDARNTDLGACWPDQTIAFPGVAIAAVGPSPISLQLQAQIADERKQARRRLRIYMGVAGVALLTLWGGASLAMYFSVPPLLETDEEFVVVQQSTVEEQFALALLSPKEHRTEYWQAVPKFFPPNGPKGSNINLTYAGKALLQLARHYIEGGQENEGLQALQEILSNQRFSAHVRAMASVELAAMELERGQEQKSAELIDSARALTLNDRERQILEKQISRYERR